MNWLLIISVYGLVGLLFGEGYLSGCRKVRDDPDGLSYGLGIAFWPVIALLMICGKGRKS